MTSALALAKATTNSSTRLLAVKFIKRASGPFHNKMDTDHYKVMWQSKSSISKNVAQKETLYT